MDNFTELKNYLDEQGRVKEYPSKRNRAKFRVLIWQYLAAKFSPGMIYTEKEVNLLLNQYHTFGDPALLRREMFENGFIDRRRDGSAYWLREEKLAVDG